MTLTDIPQVQRTEAEAAALSIRQITATMISHVDTGIGQIRNLVRGKRAAVAAELGGDAAAMLTVYNKLKDAVEAAADTTIEDIPD